MQCNDSVFTVAMNALSNGDGSTTSEKNCQDPLAPLAWPDDPLWMDQHKRMVQLASNVPPDVVFVGDSITERLNGTRHMGTVRLPDNQLVFEEHFPSGLALGCSGDTSTNLLWHLQNGMLPDSLQPQVWMILIGTNDLGRLNCSANATLQGILNVFNYLKSKRLSAKFILHGLLPRSDISMKENMADNDYKTGEYWKQIQWINQRLREECHQDPEQQCRYMEASGVFLDPDSPDKVSAKTMTDGLHPSRDGLASWCPLIAKTINDVLGKEHEMTAQL
ncbi:Platelet-activating factor acetylhydrolase IB subunit beta [Seminavis robusta]|uniref:Platelet-activating factor acetylhydrolase IB subunit beta n=1 Tax=Seminavis robusta TaxID=568900 RepID=A0A9N8EV30_9STRA|nr:Platelet-activating factor acetylhydrolase IB subunit beta [Seminavis robusta]|eukprot:Sro1965_g308260.1 Platelet-activating factor acetylhydrolase IB subunit beta (277) ;mRNA; f:5091-6018